ncbi:MAG: valine--tRNA ligase [Balneolaceae bacterium]|nr:valine--tRNA ligase [Balneolaceae bacterium]
MNQAPPKGIDPESIAKHFDPGAAESRWSAYWDAHKFFRSTPDDREPYTVVIPPPNVTGVLHMGHMLNNSLQDVLVRKARMEGYNTCWVPGTDHASIATEAKVVQKLRAEGIKKSDLSRDEFMERAWEWTHEHGGVILQQLKTLGASCDWDRTRFTMDEALSEAVIETFVKLYEDGYIYRGMRMVHWDPVAQTALSDEEVIYKEQQGHLYHVRYAFADDPTSTLTIATTRPETIMADVAIAIHPDDPRAATWVGKQVHVPLTDRTIPVIADEYVDPEFGTGCLKITPAHDPNDYEIGQRHDLPILDIISATGHIVLEGSPFDGLDRFEARKAVAAALEDEGVLEKTEELVNQVGTSERTGVVIEPRLSLQWFCRMEEFAKPAIEAVKKGDIRFHPAKFENTYFHWMENIRDWCISRQLWWGHRIPAWNVKGDTESMFVARTAEEALAKAQASHPRGGSLTLGDLQQDEDVLDTWFSSWLWPMSVFDGVTKPDNEDITYYYPTQHLVTAPEILFFWVARMIMAGYYFRGEAPFKEVVLHGIVRDKKRQKMSKSLGNSPDPLELIAQFGADGTRFGMIFSTPSGNDILFDKALCEQGRNFANKLWNAFRFLMLKRPSGGDGAVAEGAVADGADAASEISTGAASPAIQLDLEPISLVDRYMLERLRQTVKKVHQAFQDARLNDALHEIYTLLWDDYCDWYIEVLKPADVEASIEPAQWSRAMGTFEAMIRLLHPFMPFITEELWHTMQERVEGESLTVAAFPTLNEVGEPSEAHVIGDFGRVQGLITFIRNTRASLGLSPKHPLEVTIQAADADSESFWGHQKPLIEKLGHECTLTAAIDAAKPDASRSTLVGDERCFIPLEGLIDVDAEVSRLQKEIQRLEGFQKGIQKKLENPKFVASAPEEVVAKERKKLEDSTQSLDAYRTMLDELHA